MDLDNNDTFLMQSATIALTTPPDGSSEMLDLQSGVMAILQQQYNVTVSGGELKAYLLPRLTLYFQMYISWSNCDAAFFNFPRIMSSQSKQ